MISPKRSASMLAAGVLLLGSTAGAQINHDPPSLADNTYTLRAVPIDYPDTPLFDPGPAVVGDFDSDGQDDVAFLNLAEDRLSLLWAPGLYENLEQGALDVWAIAAVPRVGGDDLLVTGTAGLTRRFRTSGGWVLQNLSTSWSNVRELATLVAADGSVEIFGLDDDHRTVRRLLWDGQQATEDGILYQTAVDLQSIVPIRRPAGQGTALAVLIADALAIVDLAGITHLWYSVGDLDWTCDAISRVTHDGADRDWVALVVTAANGVSQYLALADENGTFAPAVVWTDKDVVRLNAADWNGDGRDELLVTFSDSASVSVLENQGTGTPLFGLNAEELFTPPGNPLPSGEFHGLATAADVDLDGDLDILAGTRSGRYAVYRSTLVTEADWKVGVTNDIGPNRAEVTFGNPNMFLELDIEAPTEDLLALGATHLEVEVFVQESSPTTAGGQTEFVPTASYLIQIGPYWPTSVTVELPDAAPDCGHLYYVTMRCVERSGGDTVRLFPGAVYGTHVNHWEEKKLLNDELWTDYLTDLAGTAAGLFKVMIPWPWGGDDDVGRGSDVPIIPDDEEDDGAGV